MRRLLGRREVFCHETDPVLHLRPDGGDGRRGPGFPCPANGGRRQRRIPSGSPAVARLLEIVGQGWHQIARTIGTVAVVWGIFMLCGSVYALSPKRRGGPEIGVAAHGFIVVLAVAAALAVACAIEAGRAAAGGGFAGHSRRVASAFCCSRSPPWRELLERLCGLSTGSPPGGFGRPRGTGRAPAWCRRTS